MICKLLSGVKEVLKKHIMPYLVRIASKLGVNGNKFVFLKGTLRDIERNKPIVLFFAEWAWNTVEQNLPGLVYLKKHFDVILVTVLPDSQIRIQADENRHMMKILKDSSDIVMCYQEDSEGFFSRFYSYKMGSYQYLHHKYFDNLHIDVFIRLWTYSWRYDYFYDNHPETKHIGVGHGACYATYDGPIYYQAWPFFKADKWLFPDEYPYRGTDKSILASRVVTGAPIYDLWWRDVLKKVYESELASLALGGEKVILLFVPLLSVKDRFPDNVKNIFKLFVRDYSSSNMLIVKFHPRETQQAILNFFSEIDDKTRMTNVRYSNVPSVVLSTIADCAIAFAWTTAAIDAIVNDIPVIEVNEGEQYYRDGSEVERYLTKEGEYGSFYRKNNLVIYAKTYTDLCNAVDGVLYNHMWEVYKDKYKDFFLIDNRASERMAKEIMQLVKNDKGGRPYRCGKSLN